MKARFSFLPVASFLIAIAAIGLSVHTAVSRRKSAAARRLAGEAMREIVGGEVGRLHSEARSSLPPNGAERAAVLQKRLRAVVLTGDLPDGARGGLMALIKDLTPDDFGPLLDAARDQFGGYSGTAYLAILEDWSHRDPQAALAYAGKDELPVSQIVMTWIGDDRDAALRWALQDPTSDAAQILLHMEIRNLSRTDPRQALEAMGDLNPETRKRSIGVIYSAGGEEASAVLDWIGALPEGASRDEAVRAVLPQMLRNDDPAATGLMTETPGALDDATLAACAAAFKDPEAAGQWLDSHGGDLSVGLRERIGKEIAARRAAGR